MTLADIAEEGQMPHRESDLHHGKSSVQQMKTAWGGPNPHVRAELMIS